MWIRQRCRLRLPIGGFGRAVATLVTGTGIAQVIVIATSPILTRLYSPSDFGIYAVAVSILSLLLTVTCLRYEFAIPLPESDIVAANVLALSLVSAAVTSFLAAIVLIVTGPWILTRLGAPGLAPYILLIPLAQAGAGIGAALTGWALRTKTFTAIAATRVTQGVALVVVQLGLGVARAGPPGLLVGDVVGRVSGSTRLARAAWRSQAGAFGQVSRSGIAAAAGRYRRFPILTTWSALLAALGLQAPLLLVVAFYGPVVGGEYALAARVGAVPLALVAAAVSQVFVAEAARLTRTNPRGVHRLFGRTTRALALVAVGPAFLAIIAAPFLAVPIFGSAWQQVGIFIAILVPSVYLEFVIGATGDVLHVLERQELHLVREVLRFTFIGGAIPLAVFLGFSATGAMALLSAGGCVTYLLYGLVSWRAVASHARKQPGEHEEPVPHDQAAT
jgi:O-antigen/teichoic acid export membrane protein